MAPGTFTNGDIGRVDPDGYVYLTDRAADMINSGGVNIYPAEIESILLEHPAIADAAVFGIPDEEWGESVKAAVELVPGRAPETGPSRADPGLGPRAHGRLQGPPLSRRA